MAFLELLFKYCELQCINAKSGCKYVFVGEDKTEYLEHVSNCPYNELIMQVEQKTQSPCIKREHAGISCCRTDNEIPNKNAHNMIDTGCRLSRESCTETYSHGHLHSEGSSTVNQGRYNRYGSRSRSMSGARSRSADRVVPVLTNETASTPLPKITTTGRPRHSSESCAFPYFGAEDRHEHDGPHLSRYSAFHTEGIVTPDIKGFLRAGDRKGKVTPSVRDLFRL